MRLNWSLVSLAGAGMVAGLVVVSSLAHGHRSPPVSAAVLAKQARIEAVADDLATRSTSAFSVPQREARRVNIERLRAYAAHAVFTVNDDSPDRDIPYFVDSAGTRCALAHLIEASGREDLLASLVAEVNNAYISEIDGDPGLEAWLADNGLTVEEVAFIQAPGLVDPTAPAPPIAPNPTQPDPSTPTPAPPSDARPRPTTLLPGGGAGRVGVVPPRRRKPASSNASWETWWLMNAEAIANPRAAYHDDPGRSTPRSLAASGTLPARPQRPGALEIETAIIPVLDRVAGGDDLHLAATGLVSLARASTPARDGAAVRRILAYLGKPAAPYRNYAILALGITPDPAAVAPLRDIVLDRPEGRALLRASSPIPENLRALAALALGRCGDEQAAGDLIGLLGDDSGAGVDLHAACVTALGLLAGDVVAQKRINPFLISRLQDAKWPPVVAAQIPTALARSQDRTVLPALVEIVDRFKAVPLVRQSSAIALGLLGDGLEPAIVGPLMAMAQRDPDATARQFAIVALAELAGRDPDATAGATKDRQDLLRKLAVFLTDGMGDSPRQKIDRPWHAIAAGLFARKFESFTPQISKALIRLAGTAGARDDRAAAAVALGLLPGDAATEALRGLLASTSDAKIVGYAAESLGMHSDLSVRDRLVELCRSHPDDSVRYHAVLGLARLRQTNLMPLFVAALGESRSQTVQAALTRALGTIGDKSVIADLVRVAEDPEQDRATRERALGALGLIGQRTDLGWSMDFKRGCNFMADTPSLRTVLATF